MSVNKFKLRHWKPVTLHHNLLLLNPLRGRSAAELPFRQDRSGTSWLALYKFKRIRKQRMSLIQRACALAVVFVLILSEWIELGLACWLLNGRRLSRILVRTSIVDCEQLLFWRGKPGARPSHVEFALLPELKEWIAWLCWFWTRETSSLVL